MNVPDGKGPFPVLVLNHGYIDPDTYFPGQGMPREHDYLARPWLRRAAHGLSRPCVI
jgi:hypothetical protein